MAIIVTVFLLAGFYYIIVIKPQQQKLVRSFDQAKKNFESLTTWAPTSLKEDLSKNWTVEGSVAVIKKYLKSNGSLWKPSSSFETRNFSNYLLRQIRVNDIEIYKKVVGETYGIKFLSGDVCTIYRADTRDDSEIFSDGFKLKRGDWYFLWLNDPNREWSRKDSYAGDANLYTWNYGVSTSKDITPTRDYGEYYYCVQLPQNHNLLFIDILNSPRHQGSQQMTPYRKRLKEVNALDDIPNKYVQKKVKHGTGVFGFFQDVKLNGNYDSNYRTPTPKARGCY